MFLLWVWLADGTELGPYNVERHQGVFIHADVRANCREQFGQEVSRIRMRWHRRTW